MLFRLLLIGALLFFGWQFANGTLGAAGTALSTTFGWMFEDY